MFEAEGGAVVAKDRDALEDRAGEPLLAPAEEAYEGLNSSAMGCGHEVPLPSPMGDGVSLQTTYFTCSGASYA